MKRLNAAAAILTIVGGLNWGLVGLFKFDLVAAPYSELCSSARSRPTAKRHPFGARRESTSASATSATTSIRPNSRTRRTRRPGT